ncbi:RNA-guided endonuclease TnpB family protein, partial [Micromonospora sp. DT47]|uniref:RNA-guided endonuclease TnpB family protein n=2 Tax=Micromonospora sp. DT47 TaxID=3393431 RepID=UPI003CEAE9F9
TDSDGRAYAGEKLNRYRRRQLRLRARLQAKGTKSARRLLARRKRREARHATDTNHVISKSIVAEAARTSRGVAVEQLTGIRQRVRLRKPQRAAVHSWAFAQLGSFLTYKAHRAGVALVQVDPAYTSQTCAQCGHRDKRNRPDQATFICRSCGVVATPIGMRPSTSPSAVWTAGEQSIAHTRHLVAPSSGIDLQARPFMGG